MQKAANHAHSNYARLIVNSLIVARYISKKEEIVATVDSFKSISAEYDSVKTFKVQVRG